MWAPRGNSLNSMLCAGATVTAIGDQFIHSILVWCCAFLVVFFFSSHFPSLLRLSFSHSLRSFHPHSYECYHSQLHCWAHTPLHAHRILYVVYALHCIPSVSNQFLFIRFCRSVGSQLKQQIEEFLCGRLFRTHTDRQQKQTLILSAQYFPSKISFRSFYSTNQSSIDMTDLFLEFMQSFSDFKIQMFLIKIKYKYFRNH